MTPAERLYLGVYAAGSNDKEGFINETRFTSKWDFPVQLIAGLYYENRYENRRIFVDANLRYSGAGAIPPSYIVNETINEGSRRTLRTKQVRGIVDTYEVEVSLKWQRRPAATSAAR